LQRLARLYAVPVDQLLPQAEESDANTPLGMARKAVELEATTKLDLSKLQLMEGAEAETLMRYVRMIQVQRQDFNGRVLTIRRDDLRAIAAILGTSEDGADRRLSELGLKLGEPT
jgi:hypothetical protein